MKAKYATFFLANNRFSINDNCNYFLKRSYFCIICIIIEKREWKKEYFHGSPNRAIWMNTCIYSIYIYTGKFPAH